MLSNEATHAQPPGFAQLSVLIATELPGFSDTPSNRSISLESGA